MRTAFAFVIALALSAGVSAVSAQSPGEVQRYEKGATVTLQGCVEAGEQKNTWLVDKLRESPKPASEVGKYGKRYFWLDKVGKDVKDYVGQTVQITGEITDVRKAEMEVEPGEDGKGMIVEIEALDAKITTTPERAELVGAIVGQDIPITLVRVKVGELKSVSPTCPQTALFCLHNLNESLAHVGRALHHADAGGRERGHLLGRRALAAGDDRAGVTHAAPRWRGLARDERHDRLREVAP